MRNIRVLIEKFPIAGQFTIARGSKTEAAVVVVEARENSRVGRGECVPYPRYNESVESVASQIEAVRAQLESTADRERIQKLLPPGAARNAVDCALWDLEAKLSGVRAHMRAGIERLKPLTTAYTISLGSVEAMREAASKASHRPILKIKLGGKDELDIERMRAVRQAAPDSVLIADANEGWSESTIDMNLQGARDARFALVEQPLPANADEILRSIQRAVPICADESVHGLESLDQLVGLYDYVNIKLDKTGGLTEALALTKAARKKNFKIMVGCMVGTSLGMAPATFIAQDAEFVDLDGPLLLAHDRENGLRFDGSTVFPPDPELWG